jgi:hypothetical protein
MSDVLEIGCQRVDGEKRLYQYNKPEYQRCFRWSTKPSLNERGTWVDYSSRLKDARYSKIRSASRQLYFIFVFSLCAYHNFLHEPPDMSFSLQEGKENRKDGGLFRVGECITAQS